MPHRRWDTEELRRARKRYEIEHGDITLQEIGRLVARELGAKKPISVAVVSYWFQGREPKFSEGLALARVLGADPYALGLTAEAEAAPVVRQESSREKIDPVKRADQARAAKKKRDRGA